jgi:uncharacterized membrane protein YsdA (DUF1294 family)/cold shock CspA family protein
MRKKGRITTWNDEKGYGFISLFEGGSRIFIHINEFDKRNRRPAVDDIVTFTMSADARGRPCAKSPRIAGVPKASRPDRSSIMSDVVAASFLLVVFGAASASTVPPLVAPYYLIISAVTFIAYAIDKSAARSGSWRTSESTLHLLALAGGWPGALIAQNRLRHKSRKQPFRTIFWATVAINGAAFVWLFTPEGGMAFQSVFSVFG